MKEKTTDNITNENLEKVIKLLEPLEEGAKKCTKKEACAILGIAYNTTRLGALIEKYKEGKERDAKRRAALRGKPATQDEIVYVISEYLEGSTIDAITKSTFRSNGFVHRILEENSVPVRRTSHDYFRPELIPEGAVRDRFNIGETVYSARYDSTARIETETLSAKHGFIYRIWLLSEKWLQYANQEACELASLEHLRVLGVKV